jgi:hypothetical protein
MGHRGGKWGKLINFVCPTHRGSALKKFLEKLFYKKL